MGFLWKIVFIYPSSWTKLLPCLCYLSSGSLKLIDYHLCPDRLLFKYRIFLSITKVRISVCPQIQVTIRILEVVWNLREIFPWTFQFFLCFQFCFHSHFEKVEKFWILRGLYYWVHLIPWVLWDLSVSFKLYFQFDPWSLWVLALPQWRKLPAFAFLRFFRHSLATFEI